MFRATKAVLDDLRVDILDGEIYQHFFRQNITLVDKHYCYRFFLRRGFEDITPPALKHHEPISPRNVLFMRWGGYGDALLATCLIKGYKEQYPDTLIDWVGLPQPGDLLLNNPDIDQQLIVLPHEIGLIMDQYDQVYDITHSIECNSEATFINPYDKIASWLETPLPKEVRPYLYLTKAEYCWGEKCLRDYGFSLDKDVIGIAIESSSPRRTWPIERSMDLAHRLAEAGRQVILFGIYNRPSKVVDHKKIFNAIGFSQNMRVLASLVNCCSLMISPFTCYLHMSQAFGYKKLLILAGPWDGHLEAKYYPYHWVIQGEYKCAPCFRLGGIYDKCEMSQDGFGLCMKAISVDMVYTKVKEILSGASVDSYSLPQPTYRPCPACRGASTILTAYGKYFYLKCKDCQSVFINQLPDKVFYEYRNPTEDELELEYQDANQILNLIGEKLGQPLRRVFEIGAGTGAFLLACRRLGRIATGIDIVGGKELNEKHNLDVIETDFDVWQIPPEHKGRYQLVVMRFVLEHLNDPFSALLKCNALLSEARGYVYVVTHDGSQLTRVQEVRKNSVMLGGNFPGEHIVIFSKAGLTKLAGQVGLEIVDCQIYPNGRMEALLARKT